MNNANAAGQACASCSGSSSRPMTSTSSRCTSRRTLTGGAGELAAEVQALALTGSRTLASNLQVTSSARGRRGAVEHPVRGRRARPPDRGRRAARSAVISPGRRVSFGTYFNAFPASYWRRWTTVSSVTLRIRLTGESKLVLYRSTARGHSHPVETINIESRRAGDDRAHAAADPVHRRRLVLVRHRGRPARDVRWSRPTGWRRWSRPPGKQAPAGRLSIGITTFNKPDDVVQQLRTLDDGHGRPRPARHDLRIIDQGTRR